MVLNPARLSNSLDFLYTFTLWFTFDKLGSAYFFCFFVFDKEGDSSRDCLFLCLRLLFLIIFLYANSFFSSELNSSYCSSILIWSSWSPIVNSSSLFLSLDLSSLNLESFFYNFFVDLFLDSSPYNSRLLLLRLTDNDLSILRKLGKWWGEFRWLLGLLSEEL